MRTHLVIFFADRSEVAVLKTHEIKSPNLMGWLYWQFAAINIENRGNRHTWRMPTNLIANIWHARYRRFYTPIVVIGKNRNNSTGHTWWFSPIELAIIISCPTSASIKSPNVSQAWNHADCEKVLSKTDQIILHTSYALPVGHLMKLQTSHNFTFYLKEHHTWEMIPYTH